MFHANVHPVDNLLRNGPSALKPRRLIWKIFPLMTSDNTRCRAERSSASLEITFRISIFSSAAVFPNVNEGMSCSPHLNERDIMRLLSISLFRAARTCGSRCKYNQAEMDIRLQPKNFIDLSPKMCCLSYGPC